MRPKKYKNFVFNLKKKKKDKRDYKFNEHIVRALNLPSYVNNEDLLSEVKNQGTLGTCYAHAGVEICEAKKFLDFGVRYVYSPMFLSYVTRMIEANGNSDSPEMYKDNGASLLDTAKALQQYGNILEDEYPYKDDYTYFKSIPVGKIDNTTISFDVMLITSRLGSIERYIWLYSLDDVKDALAKKYTIEVGMQVYDSFFSLTKDILQLPSSNETYRGGHAVTIYGYDDDNNCLLVRNSWGKNHQDNGNFRMSYDFYNKKTFDAFIVDLKGETTTLTRPIISATNSIIQNLRN